jgi:hypothetical protein
MLADATRVQLLWEMLEAKCQSTSWRTLSGDRRMLQVDPGALVIGPNVRGGFGGGVAPDHHSRRFCAAEDATTCPGPTR